MSQGCSARLCRIGGCRRGSPLRHRCPTAADLVDHGRSKLDHVEGDQDGDRFGQFVADRVGVAAEGVDSRCLEFGGEFLAAFSTVGVGLPGPAGNEVEQPGVHYAVGVAGIVHNTGEHAGSWWAGLGPDMLIEPSASAPVSRPVAEIRRLALAFMASQPVCQETYLRRATKGCRWLPWHPSGSLSTAGPTLP